MTFDEAFEFVIREEGGYVDDPSDSGGETKYGISKSAFPGENIKRLTLEDAKRIYKRFYWDAVKADLLPEHIRLSVFDFGVNAGTGTAVKLLQRVAGVEQDGRVGKQTIAAAGLITADDFYMARKAFYEALAKRRPKDKRFLNGWIARSKKVVNHTLKHLA